MRKIIFIISAALLIQNLQAQTIDRSKPPKAGPAPTLKIADPVMYKLENGITVLIVENHKLPKVTAKYYIDAGPITEGAKAGVMTLTGQMLNEGTKKHSKQEYDEAVDRIGANVNLYASGGTASALTKYFDSAFLLLAEAIQQPAFTQASFDKLKSNTLTEMKADEKNVKSIAARVTNALLYGTDHPYGEFQTEQTINDISLDDVKQAYQKYITPSRSYLTFVGDITPAKAKALAEEAFASWKGLSLSLPKLATVNNPAKTEIDFIDVPNAVQSEIRVTNLVSLPMSSPDYFPVLLANQILGGGSESRLFNNLREKHGFTYGAYSDIEAGRFQTAFDASASVRNAKTDSAVTEFLNEINHIRTEKVSAQELKEAKALFNGNFALRLEDPARIATYATDILINGLPKDFYRTYLQKINAVTVDDVQRVANKYFNHNNTTVVVVGKSAEVAEGLNKLGYTVNTFDKYAKPVTAKASSSAPVNADAKTIINDYLTTIGGVEELKKVSSVFIKSGMEMQGMQLAIESKKMTPNLEITTVAMSGNVVNKNIFDGNTGYQEQMGNKTGMTADDIKDKKAQTTLFEQIDYLSPSYTLAVQGVEKVNDKDAYKLLITLPSGKTETEYYDVQSKLLVKMEKNETVQTTTVGTTVEFSDYRKVGNIMIPYKQNVSISAAGQEQSFEMNTSDVKLNEGVTAADFK